MSVSDYVDEPLWPLVSRVRGRDEEERRARVEDWKTTLCIAGGLRQLTRAYARPLVPGLADPTQLIDCRIRSMLTRRAIVEAVSDRWPKESLSERYLEETWDNKHNLFLADLLSYALYRRHWSLRVIDETVAQLEHATDFARAIRRAAHSVHEQVTQNDLYRFHLAAAAYADSDDIIAEALTQTLNLITKRWSEIYEALRSSRNMRLKPGISMDCLARHFQIADQGYGWRTLAMPTEPQCPGPDRCTLGEHLLSLIVGLFDPGDGTSLDDAVNSL